MQLQLFLRSKSLLWPRFLALGPYCTFLRSLQLARAPDAVCTRRPLFPGLSAPSAAYTLNWSVASQLRRFEGKSQFRAWCPHDLTLSLLLAGVMAVLIRGVAGTGKSSVLRNLYSTLIQASCSCSTGRAPCIGVPAELRTTALWLEQVPHDGH